MIKAPKIIKNEEELTVWVEQLKNSVNEHGIVLFRGQVNNYDKIRAGKSRPGVTVNEEIEHGWNNLVGRTLSSIEKPFVSSEKRQAILQHYGLSTHYVDVTGDHLVAAWFAVHQFTKLKPAWWVGVGLRNLNRVTYKPITNGVGFIHVLVIPDREDLEKRNKLVDIRGIEKFERPKRQDAFLMFDRPPLLPDVNSFWKHTIKIDRSRFKSSLSMRHLFPTPIEDKGYKSLLDVPFVQVPLPDKEDDNKQIGTGKMKIANSPFGVRAINVVEYVDGDKGHGGIDHKWGDFTLFEPEHFRTWASLDIKMKRFFPQLDLQFSNTSKITFSPNAKLYCERNCDKVNLTWPQVNSNDIFFSYAQLQHDKVMSLVKPPFKGVWVHKENDLIIAVKISFGWKKINTQLYGVFILKDNVLEPEETAKTRYPKNLEKRVREVSGLLALHDLVKYGPMIFIPHPFALPKWYFVL